VAGPDLLPGQAERLHQPQHPALAVGDAEPLRRDPAQVDDAPGRHAVTLRVGAAQHDGLERRLLALGEARGTARPGPVAQARHALGVEPDHPVPQGLAIHARGAGRCNTAHADQHVGQREQACRYPAVPLPARQPPQFRHPDVRPDRQWRAHAVPSARSEAPNHAGLDAAPHG
jgi:hypothetical protein